MSILFLVKKFLTSIILEDTQTPSSHMKKHSHTHPHTHLEVMQIKIMETWCQWTKYRNKIVNGVYQSVSEV